MALFNNKTKEENQKVIETTKNSTHIGEGTVLKGDIEAKGVIRIDGEIQGNISSESKVFLGASAKITGNIKALSAEIEGEIIGELTISTILTLKRRGSINGNIVTDKFIIEEGGAFNGSCSMNVASKNNMNGVKHKIGHAKATA